MTFSTQIPLRPVLIVSEDDPTQRELLSGVLGPFCAAHGYELAVYDCHFAMLKAFEDGAHHGRTVKLCLDNSADPHGEHPLFKLSEKYPKIKGYEIAARFREDIAIPCGMQVERIVMLTSESDEYNAGVDIFVEKPYPIDVLTSAVFGKLKKTTSAVHTEPHSDSRSDTSYRRHMQHSPISHTETHGDRPQGERDR